MEERQCNVEGGAEVKGNRQAEGKGQWGCRSIEGRARKRQCRVNGRWGSGETTIEAKRSDEAIAWGGSREERQRLVGPQRGCTKVVQINKIINKMQMRC